LTSKVISPDKYKLRGIFTIERDDLLALDVILKDVEKDYKAYGSRALNASTERLLTDSHVDPELRRDRTKKIKKDLKSRYPFRDNGTRIEIVCQSNKKFSGPNFASIMENPEIAIDRPVNGEVRMKYGDAELNVKLLGQFVVNCIDISISSDSAFAQRAAHRIRQWADDCRRFDYYRGLAAPLGFVGFGLLLFAFLMSPIGFFSTLSDKSTAVNHANQILEGGVTEAEQSQAIELLLRFQSNSFQTTTFFDVKPWFVTLVIMGMGLLAFGIFCPKSMLALGLNIRRLRFARFFYGRLWLWVAAWTIAIITSAIGSNLYEYVRDNIITTM
jgi:hypothetical protein